MLSCLIFKSTVERGIPSLAAAPFAPATFPLLSARAGSMSSFSYLWRVCVKRPNCSAFLAKSGALRVAHGSITIRHLAEEALLLKTIWQPLRTEKRKLVLARCLLLGNPSLRLGE